MNSFNVRNGFANVSKEFYSKIDPIGFNAIELMHYYSPVAKILGFDEEFLKSQDFLKLISAQKQLKNGVSLASVYSGHQFGVWAGQLGDGRAHLLGAIRRQNQPSNEPDWEFQLKGSGLTPYSRMGDGRAVIRSSVREYLASIAMQGLGIPTTYALSLVTSPHQVRRETFEKTAIVSRVAPSFIRFGHFQHWYAKQRPDLLSLLLDYVCHQFFIDHFEDLENTSQHEKVLVFLDIVVKKTAELIAQWQCVGFVHGVMNTDNMSILGLTIDYGPYGFMDDFIGNWVCNHSDYHGRYAYHQQPNIALWNLYQLAQCFTLLGLKQEQLKNVLDRYIDYFTQAYYQKLSAKLGLSEITPKDQDLINDFFELLHKQGADMTLSFRYLSRIENKPEEWLALFEDQEIAKKWLRKYAKRIEQENISSKMRHNNMNRHNPLYILRNHIAQEVIEEVEQGESNKLDLLCDILSNPYTKNPLANEYAKPAPDWAKNIALSCSS